MRGLRAGVLALGMALATVVAAAPAMAAQAGAAGAPDYVRVDAELQRDGNDVLVTGTITWNRRGLDDYDMSVGDVRLLAVDVLGRPTVLREVRVPDVEDEPVTRFRYRLTPFQRAAARPGNRVVLTASQHGFSPTAGLPTDRTYVTVDQVQAAAVRDRIGRTRCASRAIVRGAALDNCDLVGAFLERARVSSEGGDGTRLRTADLTGAALSESDISRARFDGGRLNGADATRAKIVTTQFRGAEARDIDVRGATFDGANFAAARAPGAHFERTVLNGVAFPGARLDGAQFDGATFESTDLIVTRLTGADLRGATLRTGALYFTNLFRANLRGATLGASDTTWTLQCRTTLPDGSTSNRDCTGAAAGRRRPRRAAANRFVDVTGRLDRGPDPPVITATIGWDRDGMTAFGMRVGEVRAVAVDADSGLPTLLDSRSFALSPGDPTDRVRFELDDADARRAVAAGNRVVVTATQHPQRPLDPGPGDALTRRSYVTVGELQPGPPRGRVGSRDCSDRPIAHDSGTPGALLFCDLVGADLRSAQLGNDLPVTLLGPLAAADRTPAMMIDLTGADLRSAGLNGMLFDGGRVAGVNASQARLGSVSLVDAFAPRLTIRNTTIVQGDLFSATVTNGDFSGTTLSNTSFGQAAARRAVFTGAVVDHGDFSFADFAGARFGRVQTVRSTLEFSNLTDGTLLRGVIGLDENEQPALAFAVLCRTVMPGGFINNRDCRTGPVSGGRAPSSGGPGSFAGRVRTAAARPDR